MAWHPVPVVFLDLEPVVKRELLTRSDVDPREKHNVTLAIKLKHL